MRKLSEMMLRSSSQALVLFNDVLDGEKLLESPEIKALVNHFYDNPSLSVVRVENPDTLQDQLREAQYRADVQGKVMAYPFKVPFNKMALATCSDEFSGPLYIQIFTPSEAIFDILTITCHWCDGLFVNDYVVGAIIDANDLEKIIDKC